MRLCRFLDQGTPAVAIYQDDTLIPLAALAELLNVEIPETDSVLPFLPGGDCQETLLRIEQELATCDPSLPESVTRPAENLLVPIGAPSKLLLLAGNYSKHIEEGGGRAEERAKTFPYVFMKPPTTTLTNPGDPVKIPEVSPDHIDWELELGVVIGRRCSRVSEADALDYVAGYTVVNDISDRKYQPNPQRNEREKDKFFDWLHGKWHDTFCPLGPCIVPASEIPNPQQLPLTLRLNGEVEQDSSTSEMVFPVAAIIEFISASVTLEPGDVISTGTPAGVGAAKQKFLKAGDLLEAEIDGIGILRNPVE